MPLLFPVAQFEGRRRPKVVGTPTLLMATDATDYSSKTFAATHNSATGNIIVVGTARSNTGTTPLFTGVTWNASAMTIIDAGKADTIGRPSGVSAYIRQGATGARDIVLTAATADLRDFAGFAVDIDAMATIPIGGHNINPLGSTSQNFITVNTTILNELSLVLGYGAPLDEDVAPLSVNSPFSALANGTTGSGGSSDIAAILASRNAAVGSMDFTATSVAPTSTDDWCGMIIELLPY